MSNGSSDSRGHYHCVATSNTKGENDEDQQMILARGSGLMNVQLDNAI